MQIEEISTKDIDESISFLEGCMKLNVNEVKTYFVLEGVKKYRRSGV